VAAVLGASGHNKAVPTPSHSDAPQNAPWPSAAAVMARSRGENFAVASRLLPRGEREHLLALYGFARLTDELGDELHGDRLAALAWLEQELGRAYAGTAMDPLMVRLGATIAACELPRAPFVRLIEANRVDQRVKRYESFDDLLDYCALSANPVGELVLGVLGLATPGRVALSDRVCSALQLAEHWQDVAEDRARGRIYLPAADMRRFGVGEHDLVGARADARLRELMAFEVARARALLLRGAPLLETVGGRTRVALAGFISGGWAALAAIESAGYDVLAGAPRAGRWQRLRALVGILRAAPAEARSAEQVRIGSRPAST
jgi:squalene synthase HpnC